jgi:hypothetical protein
MGVLNVLFQLGPIVVNIAKQGQAAWEAWVDARAAEAGADLAPKFAELRSENVRMLIIAEHEAGLS